ncbi:MAG: glutathione S-transferase [Cellvibrionaceae bacterium]|jgi:glutathione S-transferase
MTCILFELTAKDINRKFSPHSWKSHLALNHKKITFESQPVQYHQYPETLKFVDYSLLPVLKDGDEVVTDSWNIAVYLEAKYPKNSLFINEAGKKLAQSMNEQCDTTIAQFVRPLILMDLFQLIADEDKQYFRESREAKLGMTLEAFSKKAPEALVSLKQELAKIGKLLENQDFLAGASPSYADICLLSTLIWIACINDTVFLEEGTPTKDWYQRMLQHYPDAAKAVNI